LDPTLVACLGHARRPADELLQVSRYIVSFDVAATANFLRHKFREVVVPVFDGIESQYLDWVTELSREKVRNDSLYVIPLGFPSDLTWCVGPVRFYNHIDRLIGPEGYNG
jgi:hypothetical protein